MTNAPAFEDIYFDAAPARRGKGGGGETRAAQARALKLHGRLYRNRSGDGPTLAPVLMLPGLTRNNRDFEDLAAHVAAGARGGMTGRDVLALSLRGRGRSDRDPDYLNYRPAVYRDDVLAVLDQMNMQQAVVVGTSLGGIIAMLIAETAPERLASVVLNDVGPRLAPEGLARIASYVAVADSTDDDSGAPPPVLEMPFDNAVDFVRAVNLIAFPDRPRAFWEAFARRTFCETRPGQWRADYDPMIGRALMEAGPAPDLDPGFRALAAAPALVVRGALSDLLSTEIIEEMRAARPGFAYCEVAETGHAPTLAEPQALAAIDAFLAETP